MAAEKRMEITSRIDENKSGKGLRRTSLPKKENKIKQNLVLVGVNTALDRVAKVLLNSKPGPDLL